MLMPSTGIYDQCCILVKSGIESECAGCSARRMSAQSCRSSRSECSSKPSRLLEHPSRGTDNRSYESCAVSSRCHRFCADPTASELDLYERYEDVMSKIKIVKKKMCLCQTKK